MQQHLHKPNSTYFDLLWICCTTSCTTDPQQIEVMEYRDLIRCSHTVSSWLSPEVNDWQTVALMFISELRVAVVKLLTFLLMPPVF